MNGLLVAAVAAIATIVLALFWALGRKKNIADKNKDSNNLDRKHHAAGSSSHTESELTFDAATSPSNASPSISLPTAEKENFLTKISPEEHKIATRHSTEESRPTLENQPSPWEKALQKSRLPLLSRWKDAVLELASGKPWNPSHPLWEKMEETLLASDIGPRLTENLLESLKRDFLEQPDAEALKQNLRKKMLAVLDEVPTRPISQGYPFVTILIGVNGAGKTTTAGKLASKAKAEGKKVILGAGDTFRAAAVEQLKTWADRIGVDCIIPAEGANPAAVAFDAAQAALTRNADELIIDTAGRLHTKDNLMEELRKVVRVIDKKIPGAPHRTLLVLDATLGQNALIQAKEFTQAVPTSGVVLTKLDGSAKGGAAFSIAAELGLPVLFVGTGETVEDLRPFVAKEFVDNLLP